MRKIDGRSWMREAQNRSRVACNGKYICAAVNYHMLMMIPLIDTIKLQNSKYNEKGCTKELQIVLPFNIMKNKKFQLQTNERHL